MTSTLADVALLFKFIVRNRLNSKKNLLGPEVVDDEGG